MTGTITSASAALRQVLICQATELARAARYDEAAMVLEEAVQLGDSAAALHLFARVRAQQDRLTDAETLWRRVLQIDADHRGAIDGLRAVEVRRRVGAPSIRVLWPVAGMLTVLLVGIVMYRAGIRSGETRAEVTRAIAPAPVLGAPAPPPQALLPPPTLRLSTPGLRVVPIDEAIVVTFDRPLFERLTRLAPGAGELLSRVAGELRSLGDSMEVAVVGQTDAIAVPPSSPFSDNPDLAIARARVVLARLRSGSELAPGVFTIRADDRSLAGWSPESETVRSARLIISRAKHRPAGS